MQSLSHWDKIFAHHNHHQTGSLNSVRSIAVDKVFDNNISLLFKRISKNDFSLNSTNHDMNHRDVDQRLTTCGEGLVVFAQPTVFSEPAKWPESPRRRYRPKSNAVE